MWHPSRVAPSTYCPQCSSDADPVYENQIQLWRIEELRRQRVQALEREHSTAFQEQLTNYRRDKLIETLQEDQKRRLHSMQQLTDAQFLEHKPLQNSLQSKKRSPTGELSVGYSCQRCNNTHGGSSTAPDFYTNATGFYDYSVHDLAGALGRLDMAAGAKKSCSRPGLPM